MTPPLRIAPDGATALTALIELLGQPGPLSPQLQTALPPPDGAPIATLSRLMAQRQQHGLQAPSAGRSPAARFMRRQHRRWRITQGASIDRDALARAGRRARRRGIDWPDVAPWFIGCWIAFWASDDAALRRDLLACLPLAAARSITRHPLDADTARRFWR